MKFTLNAEAEHDDLVVVEVIHHRDAVESVTLATLSVCLDFQDGKLLVQAKADNTPSKPDVVFVGLAS